MDKRPSFQIATSLDYLTQHYGPVVTIGELSSITTQSEKTITNSLHKQTYPIPSFKIGRKRVFRLVDVAAYIDQQLAAASASISTKQRGRPTKIEQLANRLTARPEKASS